MVRSSALPLGHHKQHHGEVVNQPYTRKHDHLIPHRIGLRRAPPEAGWLVLTHAATPTEARHEPIVSEGTAPTLILVPLYEDDRLASPLTMPVTLRTPSVTPVTNPLTITTSKYGPLILKPLVFFFLGVCALVAKMVHNGCIRIPDWGFIRRADGLILHTKALEQFSCLEAYELATWAQKQLARASQQVGPRAAGAFQFLDILEIPHS